MNEFNKQLSLAIDYISDRGFESSDKLLHFLSILRRAAQVSFPSSTRLNDQMRRALEASFKRAVSKTRINNYNPGVSKFTVDLILPTLRRELDRRIRANAELIVLNREQSIEKTLQRFSGWMTSVPAGGSRAIKKGEVKENIAKPSKQLSYETRRRTIDQGHKLSAAIDATIAQQTGAIAAEWQSHWRQPGYNYRPDHKERDEKVYTIRENWAIQQGLMKVGKAGYTDKITMPAEEIFCRCNYVYYTGLNELPEEMLTAKGKAFLNNTKVS